MPRTPRTTHLPSTRCLRPPAQDIEQVRLSRSAGTYDGDKLTFGKGKAHSIDRLNDLAFMREVFAQPLGDNRYWLPVLHRHWLERQRRFFRFLVVSLIYWGQIRIHMLSSLLSSASSSPAQHFCRLDASDIPGRDRAR